MERTLIGTDGEDRLYRLAETDYAGAPMGQIVTADGTEHAPRTLAAILAHRPSWAPVAPSTELTTGG